jgi:hypothetical protein
MIVLSVILQLVGGVLLAIRFSNDLTLNTLKIKYNIVELSEGHYPEETAVTSTDELGESQRALNNLIERLKTATRFAEKIGNGELSVEYDENYRNDVLAMALMAMHTKLKKTAEDDEKRNWATQGLAKFGELLRSQDQDLTRFSDSVLTFIVRYTKSNQGRLFLVDDESEEKYLKLISAYAWDKKKHISQRINFGQGLTGQCWQEGEPIYMTDVPENYISISSGLGFANPRNIFILPLKLNEVTYGVLELASLKMVESYEREFILKLAISLSAAISTMSTNQKTRVLLATTQQQAEEMRAQEEEMRQNMEELSAIQEDMGRKEEEYLERIQRLETELASVDKESHIV